MKIIIISSFTSLFFQYILLASFGEEWVARHNGSGNNADHCYDLKVDASGNVYVTGFATNAGTNRDMVTIKYDNSGNQLWIRSFNGTNNGGDYSFAIAIDQSSNVYVTGRADMQQGISNYTTIKYNSNGIQQWIAFYDGPASEVDEAKAICVDLSGNVYVTGRSKGLTGAQDIATVKYNSQGVQQWVAIYNGPGNNDDIGNAITVDAAGNVYVTGNSIGNATGDDYVTIKYDSQGNPVWVKRYNGVGNGGDVALSLKLDNTNSSLYVTGFAFGGASTSYDYVTIKYNTSDGTVLWTRIFNSAFSLGDFARALTVDNSGNVIVTGASSVSSTINDSNFITIKYNSNGDQLWNVSYSGAGQSNDLAKAITNDAAGNIYIAGISKTAGTGNYVTLKYNSSGTLQFSLVYNGPANSIDESSAIFVENNGEKIYVTGRSMGVGSDFDYATIKYSELVTISPISNEIPETFWLYQNYPNPFNPQTKIRFDIPFESEVSFNIYDINGRLVASQNFGQLKAGKYEFNYSAKTLPSGVYIYRVITDNFQSSRKMVVIR
ncbi:MAG: SBBP repeat-containing protein [Ignavibacteria bacterium]|nr:SBBP repeat-containing protein [Ignavibacteria bacterium]